MNTEPWKTSDPDFPRKPKPGRIHCVKVSELSVNSRPCLLIAEHYPNGPKVILTVQRANVQPERFVLRRRDALQLIFGLLRSIVGI